MKKLPKDAEASNILVGEVEELDAPFSVFVRLNKGVYLGDLTEVPLPTRFIFILLGPAVSLELFFPFSLIRCTFSLKNDIWFDLFQGMEGFTPNSQKYHEIGRSIATCFTDEVFQELAYKCSNSKHLTAGIDEFLDSVTVIPPGEWDPTIRIEPPAHTASQNGRKNPDQPPETPDEDELRQKLRQEAGLYRSGKLFGGLIEDVKRKVPQ